MNLDNGLIFHYFQLFASTVIVPVLLAFIKSEKLALDNSTQANGIYHWYRLAKQALAIIPAQDVKAAEAKIDELMPGSSQIVEAVIQAPPPDSGVVILKQGGFITMKMMISLIVALALTATFALADTSTPTPATTVASPGWGPSIVGNVGAFYLNGNYTVLAAGMNVGAAYTWDQSANVNSVGVYVGPQSQQIAGVTSTSLNTMVYLNLYQTSSFGGFGVGLGTRLWQSGLGMDKAVGVSTTYLALGYKF